ncbi:MAG: DUF4142 domain-containing protein [Ginsengibacter sp.]
MKKLIIGLIFFTCITIIYSCNGSSTSSESSSMSSDSTSVSAETMKKNTMDTTTNNVGTAMVDQNATSFAAEAATGGMMEVELGKMAQQKAKNQQVKDFGKMMEEDHSKANDNFKEIASKKNINLPTSVTDDQRKEIDNLSKKSGSDFDKAYVDMMVNDHKKDIAAFKSAQGAVSDNDIKNFIINTLPTLQKHLDAIQAIKAKM